MLDKKNYRGFLINRDIEFWPTDNLLHSRRMKTELKIFSTASRCLVCLLENPEKIVSQNDLFVAGWGRESERVKPNALYQTIMEVRRKMK